MKIVLVEWVDSRFASDWQPKESDCGVSVVTSVGILTKDAPGEIRMSLSMDIATGNIGSSLIIPKCSIRRIRRLKVK